MLEELQHNCREVAGMIPNWTIMNKNDLANLYLKTEANESMRSACFGALMCRYWGNIGKYYNQSRNSVEIEDCYEWLVHAISYALEKRKWIDPNNKLYNDPNGPDKVINMCIASTRKIFYQASNVEKRKGNYNLVSIDQQQADYGDYSNQFYDNFDEFEDKSSNYWEINSLCEGVVNYLFSKNSYIEAIVVDAICFFDTFKQVKQGKAYSSQLNERALADHIQNLNKIGITYYIERYNITDIKAFKLEVLHLTRVTRTRLYSIIRKALFEIRANGDIKELV